MTNNFNFLKGIIVGILVALALFYAKDIQEKVNDTYIYLNHPLFMKAEFADGSTLYANNGQAMSVGWQSIEKRGGKVKFELISKEEYLNNK